MLCIRLILIGLVLAIAWTMPGPLRAADQKIACVQSDDGWDIDNSLDDLVHGQMRPLAATFFVDQTGQISPEMVQSQHFSAKPCAGTYRMPTPNGALWLRFSVENPHDRSVEWIVAFMETIFDEVTLFEASEGGLSARAQNGRIVPANLRAVGGAKIAVPIRLAPGTNQDLYLRISGTFSKKITPVLVSASLFSEWSARFQNTSLILLGFTATLALFSLIVFRQMDARFYRYYTLFMVFSFSFTFVFDGWMHRTLNIRLPLTVSVPLIELAAGLSLLANIAYCRVLVSDRSAPSGQKAAFKALRIIGIVSTCLAVANPWLFAVSHHVFFFLSPMVLLVIAARRLGQGLPQIAPVCASLICLVVGLAIANYYFVFPVAVVETSSASQLMLMRPSTYSYAVAVIGEAIFMAIAISTMLGVIRTQRQTALDEATRLRNNLRMAKTDRAKTKLLTTARITALEKALQDDPEKSLNASAEHRLIERATQIVSERQSDSSFGPKELAFELGVSEKTLGRRLKEAQNVTPAVFIRTSRLNFAHEQILRRQHKTIAEVAYAAGFSSAGHFAKLYRQQFNETPRETSKSLRDDNDA